MSGPRKTNKTAADGGVPESEPVAAAPAAAAPQAAAVAAAPEATVPPPAAPAAPVAAAAAPPPATPAAPAASATPAAPAGPPAGAQVAAAITGIATGIKEKLSAAELLLGTGALLIFGVSFLLFQFLLGTSFGPSEGSVVVSALLLVLIGLERTNTEGFGSWYRVLLVLLGGILLLAAAYSFLYTLRHYGSLLGGLDWLAMLSWWAGGIVAGVGSFMTYRIRA